MVWKTREDKLPPPSYFSLIAAYLQQAYRGAHISRETMLALRPYFIAAWRNGKTAESAAQSTCSCNGKEIVPSPVIGVHIAKGTVRPPKGAQRGEVFGVDALRPPAPIERLQKRLDRIVHAQSQEQAQGARWEQRARTARKESTRQDALRKQTVAATKYSALQEEARRIEGELQRVRSELHRAPRMPAPAEPPSATQATASPAPTNPRRAPKSANPPATNPSETQGTAMLSAIQGLLPSLAGQLAAQMAQEGQKK